MRTKLRASHIITAILLLLCSACNRKTGARRTSFLHRLVDTLSLDKSRNILVYTINPNDCISCLNGFKNVNGELYHTSGAVVYVIAVQREIERHELQKTISWLDLNPAANKAVIWSRSVFDSVNFCSQKDLALTTVTVYNYRKDSVIFAKPVREVSDVHEISDAIARIPE